MEVEMRNPCQEAIRGGKRGLQKGNEDFRGKAWGKLLSDMGLRFDPVRMH